MSEHKTTVIEGSKFAFKDASKVNVLKETVNKFKDFDEIFKGKPSEKTEIGLPESLAQTNIFRNLFCNHPFRQGQESLQAPIYLDLASIQKAWGKIEFDKNGNPNFDSLKNGEFEKYIPALKNIAEVYMPHLSVQGNPNKFLKLALDYRENGVVYVRPNDMKNNDGEFQFRPTTATINSPTLPLYIGLDRIAQFLNFCVLINSLPTKQGDNTKKVEPLIFEKEVLQKLINQVKAAKKDLNELIKKFGENFGYVTLDEHKKDLSQYREKYDLYVKECVENNKDKSVLHILNFVEWMDNAVRNANRINYSGLESKNRDKDKLDILLYLDSIIQCEAAIKEFIDSKALEPSILNWFKNAWCSVKLATKSAWNFLADKIELSQRWLCNVENLKSEKKYSKAKSNQIIPKLDFTQKTETKPDLNSSEKSNF